MNTNTPQSPQRGRLRRALRGTLELLLLLSPVILLTTAFPIAVAQMSAASISGVALPTLLLAISLTVPWLAAAACLPLYRALGELLSEGTADEVRSRFFSVWPTTFVQTAPLILLFAGVVALVMPWSAPVMLVYIVSLLLHLAFSQALVLSNVRGGNRWMWAASWLGYTLALLLAPAAAWFLPPLVGLSVTLLLNWRHLPHLTARARLSYGNVIADMGKGLLLGGVLWSNILLLFLATGGQFAVSSIVAAVFLGSLAAIVGYNYYFVKLAPRFDSAMAQLHRSMAKGSSSELISASNGAVRIANRSLVETGLVSAVLVMVAALFMQLVVGTAANVVLVVGILFWLLMMITLVAYKLDYVGHHRSARVISGIHVGLSIAIFAWAPTLAALSVTLIVMSLLVLLAALVVYRRRWTSPEYALFWRHATGW